MTTIFRVPFERGNGAAFSLIRGVDIDRRSLDAGVTQDVLDRESIRSRLGQDGDLETDGLLEARAVMNLNLDADLVVLSACETARGRVGAGEGMIGLLWAFFAAGSRATLVSQWRVSSASTAEWMIGFYQELARVNMEKRTTKADALRLAMLRMMKDRRFSHPFYWAGFILIGSAS